MYNASEKWAVFYDRMASKAKSLVDPATGTLSEKYSETAPCPSCGSGSFSSRFIKNGFRYVTCNACELVYINPQLTQDALALAYNDEELRSFFMNEILLSSGESGQRKEFEKRTRRVSSLVTRSNPRLLDVGCAAGNFMMIAKEKGFTVEGLELDELYVDHAVKKRGLKVHKATLHEMHYPEGSFDAVTMWDILEHLPKPMDTLSEVSRILAPGGVLALTTINHACINQRILGDRWRYWMPPDHICSFTPKVLEQMLNKADFSVVSVKHTYMFEVLEENYFPFLSLSPSKNLMLRLSNKSKKIACVAVSKATQLVFETLKSGDIITVIARKHT